MRNELKNWTAARYDPTGAVTYPRFPAQVPGNVQYDYAQYIGFDVYHAADLSPLAEIENWYWIYETELACPEQPSDLVIEGVDYAFDVQLNGKTVYSQEGMYTPVRIPAQPGKLGIILHPHPRRPLEEGEPNRSAADQSCKPPVTYGWDFNPRLPVSGVWRPVYVEPQRDIREVRPTYTLNADRTKAEVRFVTDCDVPVTYTLTDPAGSLVYRGVSPVFEVNDVKLWWCSGHGSPDLYRWTAETENDQKSGVLGFRTVRLVQNTGSNGEPHGFPKSRYPAWVTVELNGKRIFAKGSNLTNTDVFPARATGEQYETLVSLARDCHMNVFRIWGGGGMKKPEFYDLCDRYGIMVWQEFPLACNSYDGTENYLAVLEREATSIIKTLRDHPCLILWCGGNELFNGWSGMDDQSLALRLLNKLCYELDRGRPFLTTSPLNGMGHGCYSFYSKSDGKDVLELFSQAHNTAYSEFGVTALAPVSVLKTIIPESERFPITPSPAWKTHHALAPTTDEGAHYHYDLSEKYVDKPSSLEEAVEYSQRLQADGYQNIFEEARRQWPYCSMAINWCWNEPWACAANNSVLAYPAVKKPAYDAIRQALRPVTASARITHYRWQSGKPFEAELWLLNDSDAPVSQKITAVLELAGTRYELLTWNASAPAGTNVAGPTVRMTLPQAETNVFRLILETDDPTCASVYRLSFENRKTYKQKRLMNA